MFEDCLPAPKKNGRPHLDKAAGILVSLILHGLLGYGVYHGRFTVKIIPFGKEEVRNIMIVPPLKATIPKIVGGRGVVAEPADMLGETEPSGAARPAAEAGGERTAGPEGPAAGLPGAPGQPAAEAAGAGAVIPSLSSKFQQSISSRFRPSGESGLTIALAPPGTPSGPPGVGGGAPLPDFSKYGRGAYETAGGYGTGRGTGGRQRIGISIPLKGYDLAPWASVVIDRIQRYWDLPAVAGLPDVARIRMIVVLKKSGELDSIEILEGTSIEVLDRAALAAVRAGLPFPALPEDFPGDLLEIIFEFVYND